MQIISSGSNQGIGKYNNDILNNLDNMYYVMDGATALFNDNIFFKSSDLYEYMQLLKENIKDNDTIIKSLKAGIINSNKQMKDINNYDEYELPTFTIAAMKEDDNYIEIYLLCDCLISILYKDGTIENIEDLRFVEFKEKYKKELDTINQLDLPIQEKFNLKMPIWQEIRKYANKEKGYPVGSTKENCIDKGIIKIIEKSKVDKVLLCTDGFYNLLGIPNNKDYFEKETIEKMIKFTQDDLTYILIGEK